VPVRWEVTKGGQDPATVARLLSLLPTWFGIESSNAAYIEAAHRLPTYLVRPADHTRAHPDDPVGVLLAERHFPQSAEIHFLAVDPRVHRNGAGRALVHALEADLVADGCVLLQVKTLGPSHPDAGYALTRKFYLSMGFLPVEELPDLWGPQNPCLIMIKALGQS